MIEPGTANLHVKPQNSIFEPHRIYAHAALEEQRQALRKLEDRLSG
jgi:hypothetical protein